MNNQSTAMNQINAETINLNYKVNVPCLDHRNNNAINEVPILSQLIKFDKIKEAIRLIERGADVNATDSWGQDSPIELAMKKHEPKLIAELVKRGANSNYVTGRDNFDEDLYEEYGELVPKSSFESKDFMVSEGIASMITGNVANFKSKKTVLFQKFANDWEKIEDAVDLLATSWVNYDENTRKVSEIMGGSPNYSDNE